MAKLLDIIGAAHITWLCFILSIGEAEHLVQVQEGPLYRVNGYPMSISCNVSGLKFLTKQEFTFSVYKPGNPDFEIQIISSDDPNFGYAMYSGRVSDKNIVIERISEISVLFHIAPLKADDSGTYECYTPNKLSTYLGTYNAKTTVKVIEDTLQAFYSGQESFSLSEGDSLQLECQVFSQTFQHTHLSVAWYQRGSTETRPIITLDRDFTVRPGPAYENRYLSGLIAIEKIEDTTYRLSMSQLQKTDSGEIYCQAEEWIQDPDRSWIRISHKNTTGSNIEVKPQEAGDVGSFISNIKVLSGDLQEGDMLEIHCSIEAQNLPGHFFSMAWLKDDTEVAQIGPSGVLSVAKNYVDREREGELRAVKKGDKFYVLTVQPVRIEDKGLYQCKGSQEDRTDTGTFNKGQSQLSVKETVNIRAKESGLAVVMLKQVVQVTESETLRIICTVTGAKGQLSVLWQHKKSISNSFGDIITLSREGVMGTAGVQYQQRSIRTFRPTAANFTLELSGAVVSDSGEYMCTVSEWNLESNGNMKKVETQTQKGNFSITPIDSLVKVVLRSREISVVENSVIKLICSVTAPEVPIAVMWKFTPLNSSTPKDIMFMDHTGDIIYGEEQRDYQLEVQVQKLTRVYILKILRASKKHDGNYQCQVDAYDQVVQKAKKLSNSLAIKIQRPASKLSLSSNPKSRLEIPANSNAKIDCSVTSALSNSSHFKISWLRNDQSLLRMGLEGELSEIFTVNDERITMRRTERQTFQLTIQHVKSTDSGNYNCSVEEWIQDPDGAWYNLDTKSIAVQLAVVDNASDFSMDQTNVQLTVTEGQQVDLSCSLGSSRLNPTFLYSLSWFYVQQSQNGSAVQLLTYSHDGLLQFHVQDSEPQHRLYFSRPTISSFHLSILNSIPSDSGSYYCQIDQYQAGFKCNWDKGATSTSGYTNVIVQLIEKKLQVHKIDRIVNITDHETGFTMDCNISSCSSDQSMFEVTWTRRQKDEQPLSVFTVRRDGTLHSTMPDRVLVYNRPNTTHFTLTIPHVNASDNGQYQCQIVEWLPTSTNAWRKVAEDRSGNFFVHVHAKDGKDMCSSGLILSCVIPVLLLLLVIIIVLLQQVCRKKSTTKKTKNSLWAENNPLKQMQGTIPDED